MGTRSRAGRTFSIVFYILCFLFGGYQNDTIFDLVAYPDDLVVSSSPVYHLAWAQKGQGDKRQDLTGSGHNRPTYPKGTAGDRGRNNAASYHPLIKLLYFRKDFKKMKKNYNNKNYNSNGYNKNVNKIEQLIMERARREVRWQADADEYMDKAVDYLYAGSSYIKASLMLSNVLSLSQDLTQRLAAATLLDLVETADGIPNETTSIAKDKLRKILDLALYTRH